VVLLNESGDLVRIKPRAANDSSEWTIVAAPRPLDPYLYIYFNGIMARSRQPSKQMLTLLKALSVRPREWRHGYDLMKETGLLSGTLYPLFMRMTDQGLLEAEWREPALPGRPARHAYRLTAAGLALARAADEVKQSVGPRASLA
jgi:DNA-binding PadR family transcriptional regulator